jgi:acyl-CoA thioesterase-1
MIDAIGHVAGARTDGCDMRRELQQRVNGTGHAKRRALPVVAAAVTAAVGLAAVGLAVIFGVQTPDGVRNGPVVDAVPAAGVAVHPLRIMALGGSSTVGEGSPSTAGFRGPLESLLARDGTAFVMVGSQQSGPPSVPDRHHEGHPGWTMAQMQPLVAGWMKAQRPDVVLLQVGTNDLNSGVSAPATAARLDRMLTTIHGVSNAGVIVAGVWAPLRAHAQARADYQRLASAVVARHRGRGEATAFVDTSTLLGPGDLFDGLHPNTNGYRKIATIWHRGIRSFVATQH